MGRFTKFACICFLAILLFGCSNERPESRFLDYIVSVDQQYRELEKVQLSLENAEKEESRLYSHVISLKPGAADDILYEKLLENHQKRKHLIDQEMQMLEQADADMENYEKLVKKIKGEKTREEAEKCLVYIKNRTSLNKAVIAVYKDGLSKDLALYKKINQADSTIASLDKAIKEANGSYLAIGEEQERFNKKAMGWEKVMGEYRRSIEST